LPAVGLSLGLVLAAIAAAPVEKYLLIVALAIAMGMRNALAGGTSPRLGERMIGTAAMFGGAAVGALLLLHLGSGAVLALALVLLLAALAAVTPFWSATDAWTAK
jgi:hypothetical protein